MLYRRPCEYSRKCVRRKDVVIGRAAIVELNTTIGNRCTIQTLAYVTGDTTLEDDVFIGPCVSMSNDKYMGLQEYELKGPHIKRNAKIGNNASLLPSITIGEDAVVGRVLLSLKM